MNKQAPLEALKGGDRRSSGRSNQVVAIVCRNPSLFAALIDGIHHADERVRMRAADATEKLTVTNPQWLQPFRCQLIRLAGQAEQQELRWHLAQMLPRLELSPGDRMIVATILRRYLKDRSRIVKTFAMQGLADLAMEDPQNAGHDSPTYFLAHKDRKPRHEKSRAEAFAPASCVDIAPSFPSFLTDTVQGIRQRNIVILFGRQINISVMASFCRRIPQHAAIGALPPRLS